MLVLACMTLEEPNGTLEAAEKWWEGQQLASDGVRLPGAVYWTPGAARYLDYLPLEDISPVCDYTYPFQGSKVSLDVI